MNVREYIEEKKTELEKLERSIEERAHVHDKLAPLRAKRDEVRQKLEALKEGSGERWDVLRMGFESAWAELKTAFETAMSKDVNRPS